jgi:ubiquinone/menaquinone biosynthesis C-methylase UbiE
MNCDRIARWYRLLELGAFGHALEKTRRFYLTGHLPQIHDAVRVLALGDGDGRALVDLLAACPSAHVDYYDLSSKMLEAAARRVQGCSVANAINRVCFRQADLRTAALSPAHYDLIVSHFFLDCLNPGDAENVIRRVAHSAAPGARWIVSEFHDPAWWTKAVIRGLYLFFRLTTGLRTNVLTNYRPLFEQHGFRLMRAESRLKGLLVSEFWEKTRHSHLGSS